MSAPASAEVEARIEKYRPKKPDEPASGGTLWHLNGAGLLGRAIVAERAKLNGQTPSNDGVVVTRGTAWEIMAEAQRAGVVFGS